jgi:hypothetical protein
MGAPPRLWHGMSRGVGVCGFAKHAASAAGMSESDAQLPDNCPMSVRIDDGSTLYPIDCIWRPRRDLNPCYRRERAVS